MSKKTEDKAFQKSVAESQKRVNDMPAWKHLNAWVIADSRISLPAKPAQSPTPRPPAGSATKAKK